MCIMSPIVKAANPQKCRNWAGPLFEISSSSSSGTFTFNGNGKTLNGQGASYWDGKGISAGVTKPVSTQPRQAKLRLI